MLESGSLSRIEKQVMLLLFILLLVALFLNLGVYPLTLEEPRRGLIALEMIFSDNWIVPTQNGELYFRKPPVYNWMLILSYKVFGNYSEFATRFVSVSSFVLMGLVFFRFCKRHVNERFGAYAAMFFLVSVDILFYFSLLGEIDLFYSLLTLLVFVVIYNYGEQGKFYALFTLAYFLSAIGFLTKGLPSIPFVGISLLVYFLLKRDFKRLFSLPHLVGGLVFLTVTAGYFWWYSTYHDPSGWSSTLLSESSDRTGGSGFMSMIRHLFMFPIDTLKNIIPATLLIPFLIRKGIWKEIRGNRFISFLALIFAANFALYLVSTGARSRYVYALYPMVIGVIMYLFMESPFNWKAKFLKLTSYIIPFLIIGGSTALNFIPAFDVVSDLLVKCLFFMVSAILIFWMAAKYPNLRLAAIVACFVLMRFGYSLTMSEIRAQSSGASNDKLYGQEIAELASDRDLYLYDDTEISRAITFYIEAGKGDILDRASEIKPRSYYIINPEDLGLKDWDIVKTFKSRDQDVHVVQLQE